MRTEWLLRFDRWIGGALLQFCVRWRPRRLPEAVRTILVFKFMGGGSIAVAGPLLLALKRRFPDAALVLVCTPQVAVHASLLGLFDRIDVVGDGGFLRLGFSLLGTLLRCRRMRAELLVNLEVYSRVSVFCAMVAGGGFRAGFHLPEERSVRRCYDCSLPFPRSAPVFERYNALAAALGGVLPVPGELRRRVTELLSPGEPERELLVVAPFCSELSFLRRWEEDSWSVFLERFLRAYPGWRVLVVGGPKDAEDAERIIGKLPEELSGRIRSGCGELPLRESVRAIARSTLFIGIDSAPLHWARLTGTRTLSIWGATASELLLRPAPWLMESILQMRAACSPCVHAAGGSICSVRAACMAQVDPETVFGEAALLLERKQPGVRRVERPFQKEEK